MHVYTTYLSFRESMNRAISHKASSSSDLRTAAKTGLQFHEIQLIPYFKNFITFLNQSNGL